MAIDAVNASTSTQSSAISRSKLADSFDTFLVMLTTQLKHQDPLSPMDSTEFTNQLVQFANVEQQINANSNLERLIGVNQVNQKAWSINYIGRTVEAASGYLPLQGATESETNEINYTSGKAWFNYTLPKAADVVQVVIKNENGDPVRTMIGETTAGRHEVEWDGKDDEGDGVDAGKYTVHVNALDAESNPITATTAVVTGPGQGKFSYTLADEARSVAIVVKDASGKIIRNLPGRGEAGRHEMTWDGKDKDGRMMPDGSYILEVVASDAEGNPIDSVTTVYGRVTDVSSDSEGTLLAMGRVVVDIDDILTVRDTAAVQSGSTSSSTTN